MKPTNGFPRAEQMAHIAEHVPHGLSELELETLADWIRDAARAHNRAITVEFNVFTNCNPKGLRDYLERHGYHMVVKPDESAMVIIF